MFTFFFCACLFSYILNAFYILSLKSAECPQQVKDKVKTKASREGGFPAAGWDLYKRQARQDQKQGLQS